MAESNCCGTNLWQTPQARELKKTKIDLPTLSRVTLFFIYIQIIFKKNILNLGNYFFLMFKLWIIQQFGSLLASGRYEDWCKFPYGRPVTTTFILRKDAKKISYPFKIISIQPSSVIYSFLYLWSKPIIPTQTPSDNTLS